MWSKFLVSYHSHVSPDTIMVLSQKVVSNWLNLLFPLYISCLTCAIPCTRSASDLIRRGMLLTKYIPKACKIHYKGRRYKMLLISSLQWQVDKFWMRKHNV